MRALARLLVGIALLAAPVFPAAGDKLELRGKVKYDSARFRVLRVVVYRVESPFTGTTLTDVAGMFHFKNLLPGNYTVVVMRRGLGEVRRSVVVTPALADKKGVVNIDIPFSPAEAAMSRTGGQISKTRLTVPYKANLKYGEAERRLAKEDVEGARKLLVEAVKIAPQYTSAWNFLGVLAYQGGDLETAEQHFRRALQIEKDAYEPTVNLGGVMLARQRLTEALALNQKAVELRPRDPLANAQLGMTLYQLSRPDEAATYLEKAQEADPSHFTQPQLYLSWIYERRGDNAAAAREVRDLLALRPDGPEADGLRRRLRRLQSLVQ